MRECECVSVRVTARFHVGEKEVTRDLASLWCSERMWTAEGSVTKREPSSELYARYVSIATVTWQHPERPFEE